jgi:hypothetical protein
MTENITFTERAIAKFQSIGPLDPLAAPISEYLLRMGRLFIGPGDMWWIKPPSGNPQVAQCLVSAEGATSAAPNIAKSIVGDHHD